MRMFFGAISSPSSGGQLLPAPAVSQCDGHGAASPAAADDVLVELGDDLPRRHVLVWRGRPAPPVLREWTYAPQSSSSVSPVVGEDADLGRDFHRFAHDLGRREGRCVTHQSARRRESVGSLRSRWRRRCPRRRAAAARRRRRRRSSSPCRRRRSPPAAGAGRGRVRQSLGQLDDGALQIAVELLELRFQAAVERQRVGAAAGRSRPAPCPCRRGGSSWRRS